MKMVPVPGGGWELPDGRAPRSFWQAWDWWAAVATALGVLVVYLVTLAPSVTLEDSGELVTAAWSFGVPHAPGYPVWTLVGWLWTHLFPIGNVAWRLNLLSALCGALAAGLMALLVARSGRVFTAKLIAKEESFQHRLPTRASAVGGIVAGCLLAFSPTMWSQAVVAEVYTMKVCIALAMLTGLYRWGFEPGNRWRLYGVALLWGVGLGVHPTLVLGAFAWVFFVWLVDRELGRDLLAVFLVAFVVVVSICMAIPGSMVRQGGFSGSVLGGLALGAMVWLFFLWRSGPGLMRQWRAVLMIAGSVVAGLLVYVCEPLASLTNPPMNWGYTHTWQGFEQHILRSQYGAVQTERTLLQLWAQLNVLLYNVQAEFNIVFAVLGLAVWFFFRELTRFSRDWLWFLLVAFLSFGLGFMFLSNPPYERLWTFTNRVFFLPVYCVYAMWIGYSVILLLVFVLRRRVDVQPLTELWILPALLLPAISLWQHYAESSQRNHHFSYGFGYRIFKPGGSYPEMERNAVLFGGSDAGRFVPTYLVFVESQMPSFFKTHLPQYSDSVIFDRRDVYVLAQNTLAQPSYLRSLRDQYGPSRPAGRRASLYPSQPLWLPSDTDWYETLRRCLVQLGHPSGEVEMGRRRVQIRNRAVLQALNSELGRRIFEQNRHRHSFYVEEGEVLPWMYPYLEPYGLILRLYPQPVPVLDPSVVGRDRRYWDEQTRTLLDNVEFRRDTVARAVYSKARAAIAALYAHHRMNEDTEYAYRQALELYPDNTDAALGFARWCVQLDRFGDAQQCLGGALARDSYNASLREAIAQTKELERVAAAIRELEMQRATRRDNVPLALQLMAAYARRQRVDAMDSVIAELLPMAILSDGDLIQAADIYNQINRPDRAVPLLRLCLQRFPNNALAWYNLAVASALSGNCYDCITALTRSLSLEPPPGRIRELARQDPRLQRCREDPLFQKTLGSL
jgi:tetratricopeptide (TPR) repeat protein